MTHEQPKDPGLIVPDALPGQLRALAESTAKTVKANMAKYCQTEPELLTQTRGAWLEAVDWAKDTIDYIADDPSHHLEEMLEEAERIDPKRPRKKAEEFITSMLNACTMFLQRAALMMALEDTPFDEQEEGMFDYD